MKFVTLLILLSFSTTEQVNVTENPIELQNVVPTTSPVRELTTCGLNMEPNPSQPKQCQCKENYFGVNCDYIHCKNETVQYNQCRNEGICLKHLDSDRFVCQCKSGYSGALCEHLTCLNYCYNHGECDVMKDSSKYPTCKCNERFSGDRCQFDKCFAKTNECPVNCHMNEKCQCFCGQKCNENYCTNNGVCVENNGEVGCRCRAGFSNPVCLIDDCLGYCFNGGKCLRHENPISHQFNSISCSCPEGFKSDKRCGVKDVKPHQPEPAVVPRDFRSTRIIMYALSMTLFVCLISIAGYMAIQRGFFRFLVENKPSPSSSPSVSFSRPSTFPFVKANLNFTKLEEDEQSITNSHYPDTL